MPPSNSIFTFLKKQKVLSEPFRDQIGQLNNFYLPICLKIYKSFRKKNKSTIIGLTGGQGSGKSTMSNILKSLSSVNSLSEIKEELYQIIEQENMEDDATISWDPRGVAIELKGNVSFQEGSVELNQKMEKLLDNMIPKLFNNTNLFSLSIRCLGSSFSFR